MSSGKHFILIVVIWWIAIKGVTPIPASENKTDHQPKHTMSEREFRAQYAVAATRYKSSYRNVECRMECQSQFDDPNDLSRKTRYHFFAHLLMKGNSAVAVQNYAADTPRGGTDTNQVACATPHYFYELHKTKRGNRYQLNYIAHAPSRVERMRMVLTNDVDVYLCASSFMYHNRFEAILEKPSFTVTKLERIPSKTEETEALVALDFRLTNDPWFITSGHIVFAPHLNWAVLEYDYRCDYTTTDYSTYAGKNAFAAVQKNAIPIPEKCEHSSSHYHSDMLPITENYSANITDFSLGTVNDSVFLLSHYGLPDTPLTAHPPSIRNTIQQTEGCPLRLLWWCFNSGGNFLRHHSLWRAAGCGSTV